ncbi:hypothetical protein BH09BAC6_BH09BAC6_24180 [soil metagenome]
MLAGIIAISLFEVFSAFFFGTTELLLILLAPEIATLTAMKLNELIGLVQKATLLRSENVIGVFIKNKSSYTKSEAYALYGRSNVDRWLNEGIIRIIHKKIDRSKLETVAASSNRNTYLPVTER